MANSYIGNSYVFWHHFSHLRVLLPNLRPTWKKANMNETDCSDNT